MRMLTFLYLQTQHCQYFGIEESKEYSKELKGLLSVHHYDEDWTKLWFVMITGYANSSSGECNITNIKGKNPTQFDKEFFLRNILNITKEQFSWILHQN